jgi:hypothetical protein
MLVVCFILFRFLSVLDRICVGAAISPRRPRLSRQNTVPRRRCEVSTAIETVTTARYILFAMICDPAHRWCMIGQARNA